MGTELLIGAVVDTNAAYLGRRLAEEGFDARYRVTVGDDLDDVVAALRTASRRAGAVVITGGIGPTPDDLTREAIAELTGRPLERDTAHAAWIEDRLRAQGRTSFTTALRMADVPAGAEALPNANGVALGVAVELERCRLFAIPGVPAEMRLMFEEQVLPRLRSGAATVSPPARRVLHVFGPGESQVAEALGDLAATPGPTFAFLVADMEVHVRIETAAADLPAAEAEARERLGSAVYGIDDETVESIVVARLAAAGWTVATSEVATRGAIGARLATVPGAGPVFAGTVVPGCAPTPPPPADITLVVGPIGDDAPGPRRTVRAVEMTVHTPTGAVTRVSTFGGDDERVGAFAAVAGLHLLRSALDGAGGS